MWLSDNFAPSTSGGNPKMQPPPQLYSAFNFGNETESDPTVETTKSLNTIVFAVFCCLLLAVCVVGNVLVVASFASCSQLQILNNYWIVSLSITDIVLALLVLPMQINQNLHEGRWTLGQFSCDFFITLDVLCCTCSIYHLCMISLDRSFCLHYPMACMTWRTKRSTIIAIVVTWAVCALISMIRFMGLQDVQPSSYSCMMTNKTYALLSSFLSFYLPLVVIVCMYYSIWRKTRSRPKKFFSEKSPTTANNNRMVRLRRMTEYEEHFKAMNAIAIGSRIGIKVPGGAKIVGTIVSSTANNKTRSTVAKTKMLKNDPLTKCRKKLSRLEQVRLSESPGACEYNTFDKRNSVSLHRRLQRREKRATKVVLLVLMAFLILWAPFFSLNLLSAIFMQDTMSISQGMWTVVTWMGYCNSAVNPFIYTYFNRTFRRAMLNVIRMTARGRTVD